MKELRRKVTDLKWEELSMANKEFPMFHSDHEAYGVLDEELNEAVDAAHEAIHSFGDFRYAVFNDDEELKTSAIDSIEKYAVEAACEYIQVAAMARKWKAGKSKGMPNFEIPSFLCEYMPKKEGEKNE